MIICWNLTFDIFSLFRVKTEVKKIPRRSQRIRNDERRKCVSFHAIIFSFNPSALCPEDTEGERGHDKRLFKAEPEEKADYCYCSSCSSVVMHFHFHFEDLLFLSIFALIVPKH